MKILLYGEYSGVHSNLYYGLKELGYNDVDFISIGDGFKGFFGNINLQLRNGGRIAKLLADAKNFTNLIRHLDNYDLVQYINPLPGIVTAKFSLESRLIEAINNKSKKSFLYVCGCDSVSKEVFDRSSYFAGLCAGCLKDNNIKNCPKLHKDHINHHDKFIDSLTGIISSTKGIYTEMYAKNKKFIGFIPFPICVPNFMPRKPTVDKLNLVHGINRYYTKGSDIIETIVASLDIIAKERINYTLLRNIPFASYKEYISKSDIVLDQYYGDGLGINSLFSMAHGNLVFSSYNPTFFDSPPPVQCFSGDFSNDLNLLRDTLFLDPAQIFRMQNDSYEYVINNHDCVNVAKKFIKLWNAS